MPRGACRHGKDSRGRVKAGRSGYLEPGIHARQAEGGGWSHKASFDRSRDTKLVRDDGNPFTNDWEEVRFLCDVPAACAQTSAWSPATAASC